MKEITTNSTSQKTMDINTPIILRETKTTRLIFVCNWVEGSKHELRGKFKFQKKGLNDNWKDFPSRPLTNMHKDEQYQLSLKGEEVTDLISRLSNFQSVFRQEGYASGYRTIQVAEASNFIRSILSEESQGLAKDTLTDLNISDINTLQSLTFHTAITKLIKEIEANLDNKEERYWQELLMQNKWVFNQLSYSPVVCLNDETYLGGKDCFSKNGKGGVATDFLVKNLSNSSFCVVEIKTPSTQLIAKQPYRGGANQDGENIIYPASRDLSGSIVQTENQIHVATKNFKDQLNTSFPVSSIDPWGILLIGNYQTLEDEPKRKSFNLFRKQFAKIHVITYDELLLKLKTLAGIPEIDE